MKNNFFILTLLFALLSGVQLLAKNTNKFSKFNYQNIEANDILRTEDSIIINFGKGSKIVVYVADAKDKEKLKNLDVNDLLRKIEQKLESIGSEADNVTIEEGDLKLKVYKQSNGNRTITVDTTKKDRKNEWKFSFGQSRERSHKRLIGKYFDFDLGLNTYIGNVSSSSLYELSPIGSRYVAFGFGLKLRLYPTKPLRLTAGLEFAWNNFMFENPQVRLSKTNTQTEFLDTSIPSEKSKLVTTYLNVPLMLSYKSRATGLGIAVGGYVGYRLDSYNAFVESGKDKQQVHSSYYLNSIRQGLRVAVDLKYITLFCNYDLGNLFENGKAPNLQAVSFGVKLIGASL
jgi:hypothetical protein